MNETMARFKLRPTDRALDIDCGTGLLLNALSSSAPDARLCGIDLVPDMLAVARKRLPPKVQVLNAAAEHLPFKNGQFDVVVSCNMFHYIRHPAAALREVLRVLCPGGEVVIIDWCDDYIACSVCKTRDRSSTLKFRNPWPNSSCFTLARGGYIIKIKPTAIGMLVVSTGNN